jgi:hypothetical protein
MDMRKLVARVWRLLNSKLYTDPVDEMIGIDDEDFSDAEGGVTLALDKRRG